MAELSRIALENREESDAVRVIAGRQQGVVARPQLLTAGVTNAAIDRALRSGRLHRLHQGVYSTQAPELATEDALLIAALMAAPKTSFAPSAEATPAAPTSEPHADSDDDRDLWLRRNRYVTRRYGTSQLEARPADVIADLPRIRENR